MDFSFVLDHLLRIPVNRICHSIKWKVNRNYVYSPFEKTRLLGIEM